MLTVGAPHQPDRGVVPDMSVQQFEQPVDANLDFRVDEFDLIHVSKNGKFQAEADWSSGDCFLKSVGESFIPAYLPIVQKRKGMEWSDEHRQWQCYRRGRYVEFNLVYDRGTLFGLQSGGRIESILMSLPSEVHWHYNYAPKQGSEEAKLVEYFLQDRDWASHTKLHP